MSDRDTQFAGFARLLLAEMINLYGYIDISGFFVHPNDEDVQAYTEIIARRAYDLVEHALSEAMGFVPKQVLSDVCDLAQWPEKRKA